MQPDYHYTHDFSHVFMQKQNQELSFLDFVEIAEFYFHLRLEMESMSPEDQQGLEFLYFFMTHESTGFSEFFMKRMWEKTDQSRFLADYFDEIKWTDFIDDFQSRKSYGELLPPGIKVTDKKLIQTWVERSIENLIKITSKYMRGEKAFDLPKALDN